MGIDYGEKEREFLASLKEETGRDLDAWMAAIGTQRLTARNDIIMWLRRQGFMFAKASWLERIHHNGGKPIYAESAAPPPARSQRAPRSPRKDAPAPEPPPAPPAGEAPTVEAEPDAAPEPPAPPPASVPAPPAPVAPAEPAAELDELLAKAKAYRPLAQHVIAQIRSVRPAASLLARETFLAIADPQEFARLGIGPKELRLHLALGEHGFDEVVRKGAPGGGLGREEALSHMVVLTDARQIDRRLLDLVAQAAAHVNG
jgi:hypothetical protein